MKICMTADVHIGVKGKLDDIMWALNRIREYNHQHGITRWVNLGDLTHDRESINVRDLNALTEFLEITTKEYGQAIDAFPGNHDMFMKNSWKINTLTPLGRYIKVHNNISKLVIDGRRFWILPFVHYESEYMRLLGAIEKRRQDGDVLLTHIGVNNALLNTCFLLQSWSVVNFSDSGFDRVYTGHFHTQQQVGNNLWYPGSPIPFKFDEGDVDHGFYVFDTETRTHEFIDIWKGVTRDEKTPPQYMTLDEDLLNKVSADDIQGNMVRVGLAKDHTHNQLTEIKQHLLKLGARDVKWMNLASKEDKEAIATAQVKAASASELFERSLRLDQEGTKGLNTDLLLKFNREIVAEGDRRYDFAGDDE